jgi:hypothetical protein
MRGIGYFLGATLTGVKKSFTRVPFYRFRISES